MHFEIIIENNNNLFVDEELINVNKQKKERKY